MTLLRRLELWRRRRQPRKFTQVFFDITLEEFFS